MNLSEAWVGFHFTLGLLPELIPNIFKEVVQELFIFQLQLTVSQSERKPESERNKERQSACWICFPSSGNICGTDQMQQGRMWAWDFNSPKDSI